MIILQIHFFSLLSSSYSFLLASCFLPQYLSVATCCCCLEEVATQAENSENGYYQAEKAEDIVIVENIECVSDSSDIGKINVCDLKNAEVSDGTSKGDAMNYQAVKACESTDNVMIIQKLTLQMIKPFMNTSDTIGACEQENASSLTADTDSSNVKKDQNEGNANKDCSFVTV